MYKLITSAAQQGADSISAFFPLLDEPTSAKWLAHQLLEKTQVDTQVEEKCLKIIEALAKGDGPDALGEKWWLRDYKAKKK